MRFKDWRGSIYKSSLEEAALLSEEYLTSKDLKWSQVKGDVNVQVLESNPIPTSSPDEDTMWPVIKARVTINGIKPKELCNLLMDSDRVSEYNQYATCRIDLEELKNPKKGVVEKIVWSKTNNPFKLKPYDFVSLMRSAPSEKGGYRIITRGCTHAKAPAHADYVRSHVVLGVNEIQKTSRGSVITIIQQSRYKGIPQWFVQKMNTVGTVNYLIALQEDCEKKGLERT